MFVGRNKISSRTIDHGNIVRKPWHHKMLKTSLFCQNMELDSRSIQNFRSWCYVWHLVSDECRLNSEYPVRDMFKLFACAICQIDLESGQGISIHEGLSKPRKLRPWDGPFLCHSCQEKKEAMEGKRHSRGINRPSSISINCPSSFSYSLPHP